MPGFRSCVSKRKPLELEISSLRALSCWCSRLRAAGLHAAATPRQLLSFAVCAHDRLLKLHDRMLNRGWQARRKRHTVLLFGVHRQKPNPLSAQCVGVRRQVRPTARHSPSYCGRLRISCGNAPGCAKSCLIPLSHFLLTHIFSRKTSAASDPAVRLNKHAWRPQGRAAVHTECAVPGEQVGS